jgi:PEP-CTERM motif
MNNVQMSLVKAGVALAALAAGAPAAWAQGFNGGIPAGWTCAGNCGTLGADGDITLSGVAGSTAYGYVVTTDSTQDGKALSPFDSATPTGFTGGGLGDETNGSRLRSGSFAAAAGDALNFKFNYVSSDGTTDFIEYSWALVRNAGDLSVAALLFTGRTNPDGPAVPGFDLPPPSAGVVLNGGNPVNIIAGAPNWTPLGESTGACFGELDEGCGFTGWLDSSYTFAGSGNYILEFGVINWGDTAFQAGMAFDGITVAGKPIDDVPAIPEPETYALMLAGLGAVALMARRRRPS